MKMACCIYRHWDANDLLLYIGQSVDLPRRMRAHKSGSHWYTSVVKITIEWFPSQYEATLAELAAIRGESPVHNKSHAIARSGVVICDGYVKLKLAASRDGRAYRQAKKEARFSQKTLQSLVINGLQRR